MTLLSYIRSKLFGFGFERIAKEVPGVKFNAEALWNNYTSLGAGIATFPLFRVYTLEQLRRLLPLLNKVRPAQTLRVIGGGTNLVGADRKIPNTVFLRLSGGEDFTQVQFKKEEQCIIAGAAVSLKNVLDYACALQYGGAAGLYGIPGTIGGACIMNAGAMGNCISDFIESVEVMDMSTGLPEWLPKDKITWNYRSTSFAPNQIVTRVCFRFQQVDPEVEKEKMKREILRRMRAPAGRSAGSTFRNPSADLPAGKLLERCGAKQLNTGRFQVSPDHANWIINRVDLKEEQSSEKGYYQTLNAMADKVYEATRIILKPEVKFIDMETMKDWLGSRKPVKVLVLKGGNSSEREISLLSAANVTKSLKEAGFEVREYDILKPEIIPDMQWADVVYPVLHGGFGENGDLQRLLEENHIKFVGDPSEAMRIAMDKVASKKIMNEYGITNAQYAVIDNADAPIPSHLALPLIVKPNAEGSTVGLTLVEQESQWKPALEKAMKFGGIALVEEFIDGIEATISVVNGKALPVIEIRFESKLYDYDAKYTHANGETLYLCPPTGISTELQKQAQDVAVQFAKAIHAENLIRVDIIIREKDKKIFVLEGNCMPGCTASSLLPKAAAAAGMMPMELYGRLVRKALED